MREAGETVEVPVWAFRKAYRELDHAIERTGGGDAFEASTPLAAVDQAIADADDDLDAYTLGWVRETIREIGGERGVETKPIDPLTDATFRARTAFEDAFGGDEEAGE